MSYVERMANDPYIPMKYYLLDFWVASFAFANLKLTLVVQINMTFVV